MLDLAAGEAPGGAYDADGPDHRAMFESDVTKAAAAGLRFRPVVETVGDTWAWLRSIGGRAPLRPDRPAAGIDPARERRILRDDCEAAAT